MFIYTNTSILSGAVTRMALNCTEEEFEYGYYVWQQGESIQEAFSFLNATEREFIKTGMGYLEQSKIFTLEE